MSDFTMAPREWIAALANAWWLGHRDVCNDCNCREDSNPYHVTPDRPSAKEQP